jgi:hydroxymethylpyrimidine pyrophosphatase-like HAD family hydrolase|tara:strand:+ start:55 stop:798 length:744 start_codon:yes stop_codon:yes gene_type:complete
MSIYVFDVDGVLCDRGQEINEDFKTWFTTWSKNNQYFLVTGSPRHKSLTQIGHLVTGATISFHCLGNNICIKDHEVCINNFILHEDELDSIKQFYDQSKFNKKNKNITDHKHLIPVIDYRKGSINLSVVSRDATVEERQEYIDYDAITNERINFINEFSKQFPRFDCFYGGNVSIDICLKGAHKGQAYDIINTYNTYKEDEDIIFFGDRCGEHGIDTPFIAMLKSDKDKFYHITEGYKETWEILKTL